MTTRRGIDLLHDPLLNKGTAFTEAERAAFGLRGLLPPRVLTQEQQLARILENYRMKPNDLERYIFLIGLQDRNERLFYRVLIDHIDELMPIIYTPTVGEACRRFGHIFRRPRGLYLSVADRGAIGAILANWPTRDVAVIVVTDGERILGLGDLGAHGMGIPIGKLSLYTACAGIDPARCLPIMLDAGTNNQELLDDPLYIGLPQRRVRGDAYDALVEEFIIEVERAFPGVLVQFEDFATENAFQLLARYRDRLCAFNDDIQGTAAVTLAGLLSAARLSGSALSDQTLLFLGAGSAATGIADLVAAAMTREGLPPAQARRRCWFVDSKGLVVQSRTDLAAHKQAYAHDHPFVPDLAGAVAALRPTALIGVSGQPRTFTASILEAMARLNRRPVIFALSNPTSKAECTAEEAYRSTAGRAIFASGSPFDPVSFEGRNRYPGQANDAYIFPGVGLGVLASRARGVSDEMFHAAARTLAELAAEEDSRSEALFPPLRRIRQVSAAIAVAVAQVAMREGLATAAGSGDADIRARVTGLMYQPEYPSFAPVV